MQVGIPETDEFRTLRRQGGGVGVADGGSGSAHEYLLAEGGGTDGQEDLQVLREEGGGGPPDSVARRAAIRDWALGQ